MTMTLPEALEHIGQLEALLKTCVYPRPEKAAKLKAAFNLTASQAFIVAMLYEARTSISAEDLDAALPQRWTNSRRKDPEFRTLKTIHVQIWHARKKLGDGMIKAHRYFGYELTPEGRKLVKDALSCP